MLLWRLHPIFQTLEQPWNTVADRSPSQTLVPTSVTQRLVPFKENKNKNKQLTTNCFTRGYATRSSSVCQRQKNSLPAVPASRWHCFLCTISLKEGSNNWQRLCGQVEKQQRKWQCCWFISKKNKRWIGSMQKMPFCKTGSCDKTLIFTFTK